MKLSLPVPTLCAKNAEEIRGFMEQVRDLKFDAKPDIAGYRKQLQELYYRVCQEYDFLFDWAVRKTNLP